MRKTLHRVANFGLLKAVHGGLAAVEKSLYMQGVLSSQRLHLPSFLGIGATKAGTTWLYHNLAAHPDIYFPRHKEQHYFDRRYDTLLSFYTWRYRPAQDKVTGDITPAYSVLSSERIKFIRAIMPGARLVLILRNPIERTWSEAMHNRLRKRGQRLEDMTDDDLYAALNAEPVRQRSDYATILDNWLAIFPAGQLLVTFFERIEQEPRVLLSDVFQHIGVSPDVDWEQMPFTRKFNVNPTTTIPPRFRAHLEQQYCAEIDALAERFGKSVADWQCG